MGIAALNPSYALAKMAGTKPGHRIPDCVAPYLIGATTLGFFQLDTSIFFDSIPVST